MTDFEKAQAELLEIEKIQLKAKYLSNFYEYAEANHYSADTAVIKLKNEVNSHFEEIKKLAETDKSCEFILNQAKVLRDEIYYINLPNAHKNYEEVEAAKIAKYKKEHLPQPNGKQPGEE